MIVVFVVDVDREKALGAAVAMKIHDEVLTNLLAGACSQNLWEKIAMNVYRVTLLEFMTYAIKIEKYSSKDYLSKIAKKTLFLYNICLHSYT